MTVEQPPARTLLETAVLFGAIGLWFGPWRQALVPISSAGVMVVATGVVMLAVVVLLATASRTLGRLGIDDLPTMLDVRRGLFLIVPTYATAGFAAIAATGIVIAFGGDTVQDVVAAKEPVLRTVAALDVRTLLPIALFVGLYEEIAFRGFLLPRLAGVLPRPLAIALAAIAFGLVHYPSQGWIGVAQTTVVGVVLGAATLRWQRLWPAIISHASFDLLGFVIVAAARPYLDRVL
jgi:membrane protease YdiL (CAAX protease family)